MGEEKNRTPGYFRIFCFCAIYCALFSTVKNIAYFERITLELRDVSQSGFTRLKEKCVEISSILIPMDIPDSCSYENRAIDVLSQEIVPQEGERGTGGQISFLPSFLANFSLLLSYLTHFSLLPSFIHTYFLLPSFDHSLYYIYTQNPLSVCILRNPGLKLIYLLRF